ncbi:MAG: hypothetical protein Q9220_001035 [cf. Caloplaca sp. 1 TL-2023]
MQDPGNTRQFVPLTVIAKDLPLRASFNCNLRDGYSKLRATIINELYFQNQRRADPMPAGADIVDIIVRWPDGRLASMLTEQSFGAYVDWYYGQVESGRPGMLEVGLRMGAPKEFEGSSDPTEEGSLEDEENTVVSTVTEEPVTPTSEETATGLFRRLLSECLKGESDDENSATIDLIEMQELTLLVKAQLPEHEPRMAWARVAVSLDITFDDFTILALQELKRQNLHPSRIETDYQVHEMVMHWRINSNETTHWHAIQATNFHDYLRLYSPWLAERAKLGEMELMLDAREELGSEGFTDQSPESRSSDEPPAYFE